MLYEIKNVRQIAGEPRRRWFLDDYFDLVIWVDQHNEISGFQLCYDKTKNQRALTWHKYSGYMHHRVDDGENRPGKYKAAPILVTDGAFPKNTIADLFKTAGRRLEDKISVLVYEKIIQY